ncbi:hypothetical protein E2C01_051619 [Portunus trituberculatus]|uniref:Uncharacterized protein n=1 Tax=Portunus trituberculatus TaxID=210409 RepID=A0A5B7GM99_PORTR|nr:hypothetical protein [Portunus trituberculatus]
MEDIKDLQFNPPIILLSVVPTLFTANMIANTISVQVESNQAAGQTRWTLARKKKYDTPMSTRPYQ